MSMRRPSMQSMQSQHSQSLLRRESQTQPNMEDKVMEFSVDIHEAEFNHEGWYFLSLNVKNSLLDDTAGVTIWRPGVGQWESGSSIQSESIKQERTARTCHFINNHFCFKFPKGFLKNDKNHDFLLLVEVFTTGDKSTGKGKKVGEGRFAIYPRFTAPRMKLYVEPGENYYHIRQTLPLVKTATTKKTQMHCGRLQCSYAIKESVPVEQTTSPVEPTPAPPITSRQQPPPYQQVAKAPSPVRQVARETTPRQVTPVKTGGKVSPAAKSPGPVSDVRADDIPEFTRPKSPPLPSAVENKQLPEAPLSDSETHTWSAGRGYQHVADAGYQTIEVIVHCASGLPMTPGQGLPHPYCVMKTMSQESLSQRSDAVTHASEKASLSPSWEECLRVQLLDKSANNEVLVLNVADGRTRKCLVTYKLPVVYLAPFYQYHLELDMPSLERPTGIKLYISLIRKLARLPRPLAASTFIGLEVCVLQLEKQIVSISGQLVAVVRLVGDFYKSSLGGTQPHTSGLTMKTVMFPSPRPENFTVTERDLHARPLISLPGQLDSQGRLTWNQPYLFTEERDRATLFTPAAALVVEFYILPTTASDVSLRKLMPVAYTAIPVNEARFKQLMLKDFQNGGKLTGLTIQGSHLKSVEGGKAKVGIALKLVTTDAPQSLTSTTTIKNIPVLEPAVTSMQAETDPALQTQMDRSAGDMQKSVSFRHRDSVIPVSAREIRAVEESRPVQYQRSGGQSGHYERLVEDELWTDSTPSRPTPRQPYRENRPNYTRQRRKNLRDGEWPSDDALKQVLSSRPAEPLASHRSQHDLAPTHRSQSDALHSHRSQMSSIFTARSEAESGFTATPREDDGYQYSTGSFNDVMGRMGVDIADLQNRVKSLQEVSSARQPEMATYTEPSNKDDQQTVVLKGKLQETQKELIEALGIRTELEKVEKIQVNLQRVNEHQIAKIRKLEDTCKKQEAIISQLWKRLPDNSRRKLSTHGTDEKTELLAENDNLQTQIADLKTQLQVTTSRFYDNKLRLATEKAEATISSLEQKAEAIAERMKRLTPV